MKIVGFVLLGILGLVLLILLIVLFVPLRYRIRLRFHEELRVKVLVSWLLKAVRAEVFWKKNQGLIRARALWITLFRKFIGKLPKKEEETPDKAADSDFAAEFRKSYEEPLEDKAEESTEQPAGAAAEASGAEELPIPEKLNPAERITSEPDGEPEEAAISAGENLIFDALTEEKSASDKTEASADTAQAETPETAEKQSEEKTSAADKLASGLEALQKKLEELQNKAETIQGKVDDFLGDRTNQRTIDMIKRQLGKILKHLVPTYFLVEGELGLEDPCQTAKIIGWLYASAPLTKGQVRVEGIYDHKEINIYFELRGRIRIAALVGPLLRIAISVRVWKWVIALLRWKKRRDKEKAAAQKNAAEAPAV